MKDDLIRKDLKTISTLPSQALVPAKDDRVNPDLIGVKVSDRKKLLEEYLLSLLLHLPDDITYVPNFPETLFNEESLRQIYVLLVLYLDSIAFKGKSFRITEFIATLPKELTEIVDKFYLLEIDEKLEESVLWQKEVGNVITEMKRILIKSSLEILSLQIKSAQEFERPETLEVLNRKFRDLSLKLKNLS